MNKEKELIERLKDGQIRSQKRGIHFILASVVLWILCLFSSNDN